VPDVDITRTHRAGFGVAAIALVCGLLSGCVSTSGGVLGDLTRSAESAASDLESVSLALSLHSEARSTRALTGTAIDDAVTDLGTQQQTVSTLTVDDARERRARAHTLSLLDSALDAVIRAKEAVDRVSGAPSAPAAHDQTKGVADRLQSWSTRLEKLW